MRKIYEASDGTVSIYHNNMIKTFNSFEEIENLDVIVETHKLGHPNA